MMSTDAAMHSALKIIGKKVQFEKVLLFASKVNMACRRHLRSKKLQQKKKSIIAFEISIAQYFFYYF